MKELEIFRALSTTVNIMKIPFKSLEEKPTRRYVYENCMK